MRIIDSNTGTEVRVGDTFENVHGRHRLVAVREGALRAEGRFVTSPGDGTHRDLWVPLTVRYTHPGFFLQKVAFIPS
jgi:hypothetical protein